MNRDAIQTAFIGGELSPLVMGRVDTERFLVGGEVVKNFVARHQGPLVRRRGSEFFADNDCPAARLFNFEYSRLGNEMLQFGCNQIIVGAVERTPDSTIPTITPLFEQYDGPFTFPGHLFTEAGYYFRAVSLSGDNESKATRMPNNPCPWQCMPNSGPGDPSPISGICQLEFYGGYQMYVFDPTIRDAVTGNPVSKPLKCLVKIEGWFSDNTKYSDKPAVEVTGDSFGEVLSNVGGVGGIFMSEKNARWLHTAVVGNLQIWNLTEQYWIEQQNPEGYFVDGWFNRIWCGTSQTTLLYYNQVNVSDLGTAVARTGDPARTQQITGYNPATRTYTGNKSRVTFTLNSTAPAGSPLVGEFKFLVTPTVGTPYYIYTTENYASTPPVTTVIAEFPWVVDATVYLESWEFSRRPSTAEDFETLAITEFWNFPATTAWGEQAVCMSPAPNCGCHDDFEDVTTATPTHIIGGYGWAGDGVFISEDPADCYDDFDGYPDGYISVANGGVGWSTYGAFVPGVEATIDDDFESYPTGPITIVNGGNAYLGAWAADGVFI